MINDSSVKSKFKLKLFSLLKSCYIKYKDTISFTHRYKFENRSNSKSNLCIILAGYKEFTWDVIFERIDKFSDESMDICIVSSGLYSQRLSDIAKEYGWSYISTKRNSVALAQNMALKLFPNAEYIYKLDEDIFITKNFFKTLKYTYNEVQEKGLYNVGFVAPIIPINGYGHVILLKRLDLLDYYEKTFEKVKFAAGMDRMIENNEDVAKFMWGEGNKVPHIDDLDKILSKDDFSYSASTVRFSIGAIYFSRDLWKDMYYFKVGLIGNDMGIDEVQICSHCINRSKAMVIAENTCVGHLSFGLQNKSMETYFNEHSDRFNIKGA